MVLRQALAAQRSPLQAGQVVRFAQPLNEAEESARFTVLAVDAGMAKMLKIGSDTLTNCAAWEIEEAPSATLPGEPGR